MCSQKAILYGMGNPLLDMTAVVDETYLKTYELLPNNAILADAKHEPIYETLSDEYKVSYSPGGATQNSIRVAQWYLKNSNSNLSTSFVGCIGKQQFGEKLKSCMAAEGIKTDYQIHDTLPTGVCAVLITGGNRSLVTRLDAANEYKDDHLTGAWHLVTDASFFYIAGYFLTVSSDSMVKIGSHAAAENKCFSMNLSAPFLSQFFQAQMKAVLPFCDIIFGNEDEARAFANDFKLGTENLEAIAQKVAAMPKENKQRPRIVVFTQGPDPTIVFSDGKATQYPVIPISSEAIVDTNGAGDAFVGGFLSEFVQGKSIQDCVDKGAQAAHMIIQVSGCTLGK